MKKIKVDFYADTFREGIVEVPDDIKPKTKEAREYITGVIAFSLEAKRINSPDGKGWRLENGIEDDPDGCWHPLDISPENCIKIITAKII